MTVGFAALSVIVVSVAQWMFWALVEPSACGALKPALHGVSLITGVVYLVLAAVSLQPSRFRYSWLLHLSIAAIAFLVWQSFYLKGVSAIAIGHLLFVGLVIRNPLAASTRIAYLWTAVLLTCIVWGVGIVTATHWALYPNGELLPCMPYPNNSGAQMLEFNRSTIIGAISYALLCMAPPFLVSLVISILGQHLLIRQPPSNQPVMTSGEDSAEHH